MKQELIKSLVMVGFFIVVAVAAIYTVWAGLTMELNQCDANLEKVINMYNNNCWSAVINGPIILNETGGCFKSADLWSLRR